ncbi:helix-turn-helix domain-containing protein [Laceyella sacchari]|uniref:helix-turn-helix domain-containing protein n=1 Tax=Laceyella sacchari TaxID=37482 RepID=UPI000B1421F5|nr:helix-turn-helix domain-containing protein [Laceyella sacchari]
MDVVAKGKYQEWLTEEALLLLEGWARDGLTDEQIAHNMGISVRALYQWKKKYVQIFQALKKGKEVVDRQVENALLKSALGYHYEEEALTNKGEVVTLRKYQPPNTTAAIFWLKNRKPVDWRDKVITEHEGKIEHEIVVEWGGSSGVSDNED